MRRLWLSLLAVLILSASSASAVEVAPRISDREIIESLTELKAGQKGLQQQIDDLKQSTQQQIADLRQDMHQRFQDMGQRFNDVMTLLQIIIGILVVVLGSMLTWLVAIWRRLVQVEERQKAFELQGEEIRHLRENHIYLEKMFLQILERSGMPR